MMVSIYVGRSHLQDVQASFIARDVASERRSTHAGSKNQLLLSYKPFRLEVTISHDLMSDWELDDYLHPHLATQ